MKEDTAKKKGIKSFVDQPEQGHQWHNHETARNHLAEKKIKKKTSLIICEEFHGKICQ